MSSKSPIRKALDILINVFEIYIPTTALFGMFCVFVVQVFMRYIFKSPLTWSFELTLFLYVYIVMFGACYALRDNEHVCFSMFYDSRSKKEQTFMRIVETVLILIIFALALPSVLDYAWFIKVASLKTTAVLRIQYKYLYSSFVIMMFMVAVRLTLRAIDDVKRLKAGCWEEDV